MFIFNLHPTESYVDYAVGTHFIGKMTLALDSDAAPFGGHSRVSPNCEYWITSDPGDGLANSFKVCGYLAVRHTFPVAPL